MEKVHFTDSQCEEMLNSLGGLMEKLDDIEDEQYKAQFTQLMQHFDVIHREGLSRLWNYMKNHNKEDCAEMKKDYAIRHLLAVYDLEPFDGIDPALDKNFQSSDDLNIM